MLSSHLILSRPLALFPCTISCIISFRREMLFSSLLPKFLGNVAVSANFRFPLGYLDFAASSFPIVIHAAFPSDCSTLCPICHHSFDCYFIHILRLLVSSVSAYTTSPLSVVFLPKLVIRNVLLFLLLLLLLLVVFFFFWMAIH